jgi:CHAT domain-containing protein
MRALIQLKESAMHLLFALARPLALVVVLASCAVGAAEPPSAGPKPLTPQQRERLKERDRYEAEARQLGQANKLGEMVAAWEKKLAIEREILGAGHPQVALSLEELARLQAFREDFAAARQAHQEVLTIRRKLHGDKDWRVADARRDLEDVDRLSKLTPANRRRLWQANTLSNQVFSLWQQGRSQEALPLARQTLAIRRELLGEDHPHSILSLFNVAAQYHALHRYADAKPLYEQARDLYKRRLGEDHPDYAMSLHSLAGLYRDLGDPRQARPLLEQVRDLRQRLLGEGHPDYAASLNNLAGLYQDLHDYRKALVLFEQARDLTKRLRGENHPDYAQSLHNLAAIYRDLGEYRQALPLLEQARDLTKRLRGENHPDYARNLNNLAQLYEAMGDYRQALPLSEQARDLAKRLLGEDHPAYATSLINLAELYQAMGEYRQALSLSEQARDLRKRILGEDHPHYATSLSNVAALYQDLGDYRQALSLSEQVRDLTKRIQGADHPAYATCLHNLAELYRDMGDYRQALPLFEQARDLFKRRLGEDSPSYVASLNDLTSLYKALGDYRQALPLCQQARDLTKRLRGADHPDYATSLNNLAALYLGMGEYRQALPLFEQARDLTKRTRGADHPDYAINLNNLAVLYRDLGDYRQALPLSEQARDLTKRRPGADHPHYALSLLNLARLHLARNHPAEAAPPVTEALTRQRAFLDRTFDALSGRQRLDALQQHQQFLHVYLSIASETGLAAAECYPRALAWKGAVAARHAEERLALDQPDLQPLLDELRQRRAGLARLARLTPASPQQQADWRQRFDDMERRKEKLEAQLAGQSDAFRQYRALRQATARQVADALPPATALVDFLEYTHYSPPPEGRGKLKEEGRLLAFVLVRGREPVCLTLGPTEPIAQAVRAWRRPVQSSPPGRLDDRAGHELRRRVWQPVQQHLAGAAVVLLAPDGALTGLPFAALPGGQPGSFLLEEFALGYVTSGQQLLELAIRVGRPADGLLALGGLPYGAAPDAATVALLPGKAALEELPGTRLEVEGIERAFRRARPGERVTLLTGATIDAARLQRELPAGRSRTGYRYLHLATHGFFEPPPENVVPRQLPANPLGAEYRTFVRNPMLLSGLMLAGANRDPSKAVLTAEEVAGLDLRGAELVVLSACDTGLGKVAAGEGVLGLQRGFHEAGARTLAVSLWSVSDAATSVLMDDFYHNLWQKRLTRLEALRQAQLAVLRDPGRVEARAEELQRELARRNPEVTLRSGSKKPLPLPEGGRVDAQSRRSHPAYWAAFVLSGDTGPLPPAAPGSSTGATRAAEPPPAGAKPLTLQQRERLKERDRYEAEARQLGQANKLREMVAAWQQKLAIEREVLGAGHPQVALSLEELARMQALREDFPAARQARQEVLAIRMKLYGDKDWRVADARRDLADVVRLSQLTPEDRRRLRQANTLNQQVIFLRQRGRSREALPLVRQTMEIRLQLLGGDHPDYADSLNRLARIYQAMGEYRQALPLFEQALDLRKRILGTDHPLYAASLNNLAGHYQAMGNYRQALPLFEQARDLTRRTRGTDHPYYATSLNNLALLYEVMGDYRQALPLCQQALDLRQRIVGTDHPDYAASLHNLATLYRDLGDYRQALTLFEQARDLTKRTQGADHPHYATSLDNLATLYKVMGEYRQALPLYQQARDLRQRLLGADHPDYAASLNNLALLYWLMGNYRQALPLFKQARDLRQRVLGEDHPSYATSLNNLAMLYKDMGDYRRALPLYEQARDLHKRLLGADHPLYAQSLHNLAALYRDMGDYHRALPLDEQARSIRQRILGTDHLDYALSLHNLAVLYRHMGDYRQALALHQQARDLHKRLLGENHPRYTQSLISLAVLYRDLGDHRQALPLFEQARDLAKRRLGADHPLYAQSLHNLAALYRDLGDYHQALPLFEQARDLTKRIWGTDHPEYATSLHSLATLYRARGDYRQALSLFEQARDLYKRILGADHPNYAASLLNLSSLHIARNCYTQAAPSATEALARQRALLDLTFGILSGRQRLDTLQQHQPFLHAYLSIAAETGLAATASYPHVLAWKGAVAARHAEERLALDQPDLQPLLDELRQRRAGLARLARLTPANPQQQADWRQRFDDMERAKEELETRFAAQSEAFRQYRNLRQATARQVADALSPATALVDFLEYIHCSPPPEGQGLLKGEGRLLAFVLVRGREPVCVQLGPTEPIAEAVRAWRRPLQSSPPGRLDDRAAGELRRRVWQPLQKHLAGASVVLLAPDGALTALPFAALPGSQPGAYLLEEVAIGYVTSGRQLLELVLDTDRPAEGLLALGGLPYGAAPNAAALALLPGKAALEELPGTRLEVESLARAFRRTRPGERVTVLTGDTVDAARLQRELPAGRGRAGYRYLHLATHGFFEPPPENTVRRPLPDDPLGAEYRTFVRNPMLLSGLMLAGANRDPAKAVLTAEEVAGLDLRGVQLVVLSACDTGLGKVAAGEGVLGLQRGFHEAGARALAASLWSVSDAATSVLMEDFYTNLWHKRLTRLEALRQAQLAVLRDPGRVEARDRELRQELAKRGAEVVPRGGSKQPLPLPEGGRVDAKARRSHPAYWAAFVLSGDPGPLPSAARGSSPGANRPDP